MHAVEQRCYQLEVCSIELAKSIFQLLNRFCPLDLWHFHATGEQLRLQSAPFAQRFEQHVQLRLGPWPRCVMERAQELPDDAVSRIAHYRTDKLLTFLWGATSQLEQSSLLLRAQWGCDLSDVVQGWWAALLGAVCPWRDGCLFDGALNFRCVEGSSLRLLSVLRRTCDVGQLPIRWVALWATLLGQQWADAPALCRLCWRQDADGV